MSAEKLAEVIAEHRLGRIDLREFRCACGAVLLSRRRGTRFDATTKPSRALASHQAAMVIAHLKEQGVMSVWRFTYPATGRTVERTTISWERDIA